jgi:hypothetical protein
VPNRYVRESAIESETVDRLSWAGEVFWRRLLNRVDDFGRYTANRELLRAALFPLRLNKVSAADVGKMLLECEQSGLVSTWKGEDGKEYLVMHKWEKGRAHSSRYPEPPPSVSIRLQTSVYRCEHMQTDVPDSDPDSDNDPDSDSDSCGEWFSLPAFADAWKGWEKSRKKKAGSRQYATLARISGGQVETAIAILNQSADNQWQGLFPLKGTHGTHKSSRADRLDRDATELIRDLRKTEGLDSEVHPAGVRVHPSTRTGT